MNYSSQEESVQIANEFNFSSSPSSEKIMKTQTTTSNNEELNFQNVTQDKPSSTRRLNKSSTLIQKLFDVTNLETFGSTMIIADNFYVCIEQNKIYLNSEDEKFMLGNYSNNIYEQLR